MSKEAYSVWCEYDLGLGKIVFESTGAAEAAARKALKDCCVEETFEQLQEQGLINIQPLEFLRD